MYKMKTKIAGVVAGVTLLSTILTPMVVFADREDAVLDKPYVSLGADLKPEQKAKVLELLEISESDLAKYTVATITNEDEHEYLDSYLSASVIGTKALSSVKVIGKEAGNGIKVTTKNISYCTVGMYQNALVTAGIEDADITVAGPFNISGTAALVGAIESYANMTGEELAPENVEAATNELVLTAQLADDIGNSGKAEELVGAVKDIVVSNDFETEAEVLQAIEDTAAQMDLQLTEENRQQIMKLMQKIDGLDLDVDSIKEQAKDLYDKLENLDLEDLGISQEKVDGFFAKLGAFFSGLFDSIKEFFNGMSN